ncbi:MAG: A/G-specific adenine glycosylase [Phycisphaerales bacterium]
MNDSILTRQLEAWFRTNARDLPWRLDHRDPYHALVSECMLQQTQVSRVLEKYQPFIDRFPTIESLAQAHEDEVLAMWAGLGYYRRARMLHACAQAIIERFGGRVPTSVDDLESLPGIGRYSAGAIASMVFHQRAPIVDGNVVRVLMRVHDRQTPQTDKQTVAWSWERARELVDACDSPAAFNEAMMELGATICTPQNIRCDQCPLRDMCQAHKAGSTESVPMPKPRAKQKYMYCASVCSIKDGSILLEQRDEHNTISSMWRGMYQPPTVEREDRAWTLDELATHLGVGDDALEELGRFTHITTHRIVEFAVYRSDSLIEAPGQTYRTLSTLDQYGMSNAQRKVLALTGIE